MKHISIFTVAIFLMAAMIISCKSEVNSNHESIKSEIEKILKIQEDAYQMNNEEGKRILASTCADSLLFIGGDDGGQASSVQFYVHDLADGYSKKPSERTFRIYDQSVIVTALQQTFKVFNKDTIFFNSRSTKVFVKQGKEWKMSFVTYAPLPVHYNRIQYTDSRIFRDYVGLYAESPVETDTISVDGDKLFIAYAGAGKSELIPINDSSFIGEGYFGKTVFSRNEKGIVTHSYYQFNDGQRLVFPKVK